MTDMYRLDFKRGTVEKIDPTTPPRGSDYARSLDDLKIEMREQERGKLLKEINGWLLDQAEADDADGAEYDADFCRKIARDLAEHFKPC